MSHSLENFDIHSVPSPSYIIDEVQLEKNLQILADVQARSGAKVLLALKAFSMFDVAPLIMKYLSGTCASGPYEAQLGREEYGGEVHTYAAAYRPQDIEQVLALSNHVVFNSFNQWQQYKAQALVAQKARPQLSFGLRINPEHSEGATAIYDPCAPCSRMGIPLHQFENQDLSGIDGLHFHTLCEQDFAPLSRTLDAVESRFGHLLAQMKWINFGGGHHITRDDYQVDALIERVKSFSKAYNVQVYLEPGEAIALNAGIFVAEVLDTFTNNMELAILDASATCHMPDVLEMPYRPQITGAGNASEKPYTYRLGGPSCLSGDVIGDYSFDQPLKIGERLMFEDMAIYTMVKNTTFNGIPLPAIIKANSQTGEFETVKTFSYQDFKMRLS
ncbi:carboxynorspermidine decarboxylase [Marinagarivorans cellulosilyticus]|uniref:Carboxynorspermidine/carboxyspermidine decarboxylase n=1 Tax=Marinagarivorans cellulosilyticus TaxID=2721545 RepID=A0AAN1WI75_9GAMM|nr:carboxynorspermidine decarboxylase [Marinagarivorans cellulosilyticus]BCD98068.1 carboxynorspermidine decarboxylase [Marinagarivorans cellulosilyticus]